MILAGRLTDWSVLDLLQIMRITGKTGSLEVEGSRRRGVIYFRDGEIVHAELVPSPPSQVPPHASPEQLRAAVVDVVYVLHLLKDGSFTVGTASVGGEGPPPWSTPEILEEVQARLQVEEEIRQAGISDETLLRLVPSTPGPVELQPEDWLVLAALTAEFSITELEWRLGRSTAVAAVRSLQRAGLLEIEAAPPDPGDQEPAADVTAPQPVADTDPTPRGHQEQAVPAAGAASAPPTWWEPAPDEAATDAPSPSGGEEAEPQPQSVDGADPEHAQSWADTTWEDEDETGDPIVVIEPAPPAATVQAEPPWDPEEGPVATADDVAHLGITPDHGRAMRTVVSPRDTILVAGVLSELNRRFRVHGEGGELAG